ncbi:hypothetical protein [Pseudolactococcus chungangensis]|uniref:hypothetical protein n=1 Tax=Pseudolactococcus chungangensis TaxID=451457 RepID=UPI0028D3AABA|nr:hypothetical protein [Lactococcus chungangensis]
MNKFKQVRQQKNSDDKQAELFADTMDMVARERAVTKLYDGKKFLQVHNLGHAINIMNQQLGNEYDNMMMNTSTEEMRVLHDGIKLLINGWQYSNEMDIELAKTLHDPQDFSDYQDYIKHLLRLSSLETTIKILGNFK